MEKMTGLFVFDQQNDIVFTQLNNHIRKKLIEIAKKQELLPDDAVCFFFISPSYLHLISSSHKKNLLPCCVEKAG